MGKEINCTVKHGNKSSQGKALLETSEVLFRGDFRLKIPFADLQSVVASDGELRLKWKDGSAIFDLGDYAAKWAYAILHPKSTSEKLGVKPGLVIATVGKFEETFQNDLRYQANSFSYGKPLKDSDLMFYRAERVAELARVEKLVPYLASAGALWIVYPKGRQDIKESHVFAAGKAAGLVDVKVVKFSETHTALKFVRPKAKR